MRRRLLLATPMAIGGCAALRRRTPQAAQPPVHAVLGPPYQAGGVWKYPRTSYDDDETGLAVVTDRHGAQTSDGAPWDAGALVGAHPTLQLPSVVRVTNLESGRQILLRLDDRGPASAGRLLAVSPRAALLLGTSTEGGVMRVRVQVEEGPSRQLTAQLGDVDAPLLAIAPAPVTPVRTEGLGATAAAATSAPLAQAGLPDTASPLPLRLPEAVLQLAVRPTRLWIDAGGLGQRQYADLLAARLGGLGAIVIRSETARPEVAYRIRIGPLLTVAEADDMLDRVLRAGVVDGRIIVQ